jgi:uncharacterized membrane protein
MGADGLEVKPVTVGTLGDVLACGVRDFRAAPLPSLLIASVYTFGGWLLALLLVVFGLPYLIYPLAMGVALIAPFVAVAFYQVSRMLEQRQQPTIAAIGRATVAATGRDIRWMAFILAFALFIWLDMAAMITLAFFGAAALDVRQLAAEILTTGRGLVFLVAGHGVGAIIAALVFSITAISLPLLHDRDVDVISAIITSVRLVRRSPIAMGTWCLVIAAGMVAAVASGLVLLPIILPIIAYATWHLYRRSVA